MRKCIPRPRVFYLIIASQKPLPASEINVNLSGRESEKLRFSAEVETLDPGTSTFRLFCPVCCPRLLRTQAIYSIRIQVLFMGDLRPRTDRGGRVKSSAAMEPPNDPEGLQQGFTNQAHWPHSNPPRKG